MPRSGNTRRPAYISNKVFIEEWSRHRLVAHSLRSHWLRPYSCAKPFDEWGAVLSSATSDDLVFCLHLKYLWPCGPFSRPFDFYMARFFSTASRTNVYSSLLILMSLKALKISAVMVWCMLSCFTPLVGIATHTRPTRLASAAAGQPSHTYTQPCASLIQCSQPYGISYAGGHKAQPQTGGRLLACYLCRLKVHGEGCSGGNAITV